MDDYLLIEELVDECVIKAPQTERWKFPTSIDTKAKDHLKVLVTDHWPKKSDDEDLPMRAKLEIAVDDTFREMIREYKRYFYSRKYNT
jgi:hypothetical protein